MEDLVLDGNGHGNGDGNGNGHGNGDGNGNGTCPSWLLISGLTDDGLIVATLNKMHITPATAQ